MLYVNISKERKLICSKRKKKWVEPREEVEVDSVDKGFLGLNASSLMPKEQYEIIEQKKAKRRARKLRKREAARSVANVKSEVIPKKKKKVLPKKKEPVTVDLKAQREKLKEVLVAKNKKDLVAFSKDVLGLSIRWIDRKDAIILKALNAAKKVGYLKIIKKA